MLNNDSTPQCGILYVDDEEKALKYFRMAFAPKFKTIFTAPSAQEGLEVLRREKSRIGIVLSDQRMPEMLGAEFLGIVKEEFPNAVRILTTAYSDLESAIQAVNTGHIYQYVVKPWEIPDLNMVLRRAADYYHILSERNELLGLKMTTLQRILCSDRLNWLLLWSRSLDGRKQTAFRRSLSAMVNALPEKLNPLADGDRRLSPGYFEISKLVLGEYRNASRCLDSLETSFPGADSLGDRSNAEKALAGLTKALAEDGDLAAGEITVETDSEFASNVRLKPQKASFNAETFTSKLFGLLVERESADVSIHLFSALLAHASGNGNLRISLEMPGGAVTNFDFSLKETTDMPEDVIHALYEKFSASDISRL